MSKRLSKTVLAGGVVYPAGTPATEELEAKISAKFWIGSDPEPEPAPKRSRKSAAKRED